jgi:hypothetical protein
MSYFLECLELTAIVDAVICIIALISITIADAVDYHFSKKRGEI